MPTRMANIKDRSESRFQRCDDMEEFVLTDHGSIMIKWMTPEEQERHAGCIAEVYPFPSMAEYCIPVYPLFVDVSGSCTMNSEVLLTFMDALKVAQSILVCKTLHPDRR